MTQGKTNTKAKAAEETDVKEAAADQVPATIDFAADAGSGFEHASRDSYMIPFLKLLQGSSPQVKKSDPRHMEGVEEGMMMNSVTEKIYNTENEGVEFIPVLYDRKFIIWKDDTVNSGLVDIVDEANGLQLLGQTHRNDKGHDEFANGNILQDVREHYGLVVEPDGTLIPVCLSMSYTQIKHSRRWMTNMNGIMIDTPGGKVRAPMFSHRFRLTSMGASGNGNSWMEWKVELIDRVSDHEQYATAKQFYRDLHSGAAKVDETQMHDTAAEQKADDDVPF